MNNMYIKVLSLSLLFLFYDRTLIITTKVYFERDASRNRRNVQKNQQEYKKKPGINSKNRSIILTSTEPAAYILNVRPFDVRRHRIIISSNRH